ncbi:MAG: DUF4105 domain-containing protein [Bacteroides sp.]|nr:DUF4105 domain-containing protein [Bacteroides sp.]
MTIIRLISTLTLALVMGSVSMAKAQSSSSPAPEPDTTITVSLLTAAPGPEIYQLEGHSGLRIRTAGSDMVANWGLFDFNTPNFVYRFVKGETDYCVGLIPFSYILNEYQTEKRRLTEQVLNLTPQQARKLSLLVMEAVQPQNRTYRYNYVLDNCATRPIAFIEKAVADSIHFPVAAAQLGQETTFRNVMRHFHANYPWYQFGIDLALGSGIDYPISVRQTAFAPVVLEQIAAHALIGDSIPLIRSTVILNGGPESGPILPPTPWYLTPLTAMWILAAICLCSAMIACKKHRLAKIAQSIYFGIIGLMGCIIAFLVCVSTHEATSPNWIILWLNPLALLVPLLIGFKCCLRPLRWYMILNLSMIVLYAITCAFGTQSPNAAFLPLALSNIIMTVSFLHTSREPLN